MPLSCYFSNLGDMDHTNPDIHLNLNVRGMKPSATLQINEMSNALQQQGRHVYRFGLGQSPFPVPDEVVDALRINAFQKDYLPVRGLKELREAVAGFNERVQQIYIKKDNVLIGPGSKELIFILQLVYYGELIIPTPSWVSYAPQAKIIGRNITWLPTRKQDNWLLQPEMLERIAIEDPYRPRLVILNYPSNPTGYTYSSRQLKDLATVARKYKMIIVSDEIYGLLNFEGNHNSIAHYYPEGTIISSGLSKWCGAGGWRLGTFSFPPGLQWLQEAMAVVASETFTSTSAPIQYAAVKAFTGSPDIDWYLQKSRTVLKTIGNFITDELNKTGIETAKPDGGFYLFPDFSNLKPKLREQGIHTSKQFCEKLLQDTGVAILPGTDFGRPAGEMTCRLAYVDFDGKKALEKNFTDAQIKTVCPNIYNGTKAMVKWLKQFE